MKILVKSASDGAVHAINDSAQGSSLPWTFSLTSSGMVVNGEYCIPLHRAEMATWLYVILVAAVVAVDCNRCTEVLVL